MRYWLVILLLLSGCEDSIDEVLNDRPLTCMEQIELERQECNSKKLTYYTMGALTNVANVGGRR